VNAIDGPVQWRERVATAHVNQGLGADEHFRFVMWWVASSACPAASAAAGSSCFDRLAQRGRVADEAHPRTPCARWRRLMVDAHGDVTEVRRTVEAHSPVGFSRATSLASLACATELGESSTRTPPGRPIAAAATAARMAMEGMLTPVTIYDMLSAG